MIVRQIIQNIKQEFFQQKAIILLGARQVGKSTLLKTIFNNEESVLWLDAENPDVHAIFENATATRLKMFFEDNNYVIIDEAQKIENIGSKLKLITDYLPEIQVIATGSSAFELRNKLVELSKMNSGLSKSIRTKILLSNKPKTPNSALPTSN